MSHHLGKLIRLIKSLKNTLAIMVSLTENEYLQGILYGYEFIVMIVLFKNVFSR